MTNSPWAHMTADDAEKEAADIQYILGLVNTHGKDSLSAHEKRLLDGYSQNIAQRVALMGDTRGSDRDRGKLTGGPMTESMRQRLLLMGD